MFKQMLGASLAALSFASAPALAQSWDFTAGKSYVFGDSLSDTGNVFLAAKLLHLMSQLAGRREVRRQPEGTMH